MFIKRILGNNKMKKQRSSFYSRSTKEFIKKNKKIRVYIVYERQKKHVSQEEEKKKEKRKGSHPFRSPNLLLCLRFIAESLSSSLFPHKHAPRDCSIFFFFDLI